MAIVLITKFAVAVAVAVGLPIPVGALTVTVGTAMVVAFVALHTPLPEGVYETTPRYAVPVAPDGLNVGVGGAV